MNEGAAAPTPAPSLIRRVESVFGTVIVVAGAGWLGLAVWKSANQLSAFASSVQPDRLAVALLPALATVWTSTAVYYFLLRGIVPNLPGFQYVAGTYLTAQLARYTPGKVWSVLYLSQKLSEWVPARYNWAANLEQMVVVQINSMGLATSVFLYREQHPVAALVAFAASLSTLYVGLQLALFQRLVRSLSERRFHTVANGAPVPKPHAIRVIGLLQLDWLAFFLVWALILPQGYPLQDIVAIAVCYAIAWLAGFLAFVLPGGLVVREASFVWLGGFLGFDSAALLLFSVAARFVFTVTDVIGGASGLALARWARR